MYYNNSIDDFKVEYPPYLKWGGKYININKPTLLDNSFNSANSTITVNYDWCESNLPQGKYKFKISLCEFKNHDAILIDMEDILPINDDSSLGYKSPTYHIGNHDFLKAEYNNVGSSLDISSVIDKIATGEASGTVYQIKIEVIKIGGWSNEEQKRGFEKVYTTFSQPFKIN